MLGILFGLIRIRNLKLLDPDPHWEEQLDLDPQKMNVDPQPGCKEERMLDGIPPYLQ